MFERVLNKLYNYIEILGILFQSKLENFKRSNKKLFREIRKKSPQIPEKGPSSLILGKIYSFMSPENFSTFRLYVILGMLFPLGAFLSFIPVLYPKYIVLAFLLFFTGILMVGVGGRLAKRMKVSLRSYKPNSKLWTGFFVLGLVGLLINFLSVGIPLFNSYLRPAFHNQLWSVSYIFYTIGMMVVYVKNQDPLTFSLLFALSLVISVLSGFRTDFLILLGPLLIYKYLKGEVSKGKVFYLVVFFLVFIIGIRYMLLAFSSIQPSVTEILSGDIFFAKIGLDFYVLSIFIRELGFFGAGGGMISLGKFFLQQLHIPSLEFGAVGSDIVINTVRRFESSLVGPTFLDMGVPGVLVVSAILGFFAELPKRVYDLLFSDFFLALYSINVSIMIVWLQTGLVQYYLFFMFFGIGLYCLSKLKLGLS